VECTVGDYKTTDRGGGADGRGGERIRCETCCCIGSRAGPRRDCQKMAYGCLANGEEGRVFLCFPAGEEEDDGEAAATGSTCSTGAMEESGRIGWRVELQR